MDGGIKEEILISIVKTTVVNIMKEIGMVKIFIGAALPWRKVPNASEHLLSSKD